MCSRTVIGPSENRGTTNSVAFATRAVRLLLLVAGFSIFGAMAATSLPTPLPAGKRAVAVEVPLKSGPAFEGLIIGIVPGGAALAGQ